MLQFSSDSSVLDDIDFIQKNYTAYFDSLELLERSRESVKFRITPSNDTKRSCDVLLNRQCYEIIADTRADSQIVGGRCESLEQLLELIMGGNEFSSMLMRLTAAKLNNSSS